MKKLINSLIIVAVIILPTTCEGNNNYEQNILHPKKKYLLSECLVRANFDWDKDISISEKASITDEAGEILKQAITSGEFPLFSYHTTRSRDYFVFYFADDCKKRKYFVQKLVTEYIEPKIEGFPKYQLQDKGIEVGSDGVTPSGWWRDY